MAETKPAWGAKGITEYEQLPEATFRQILEKIPFPLPPDQEAKLLQVCERFKAGLKIFPLPRRSNVYAALKAMRKRISRPGAGRLPALRKMIHELDGVTRIMLATQDSKLSLDTLTFMLEVSYRTGDHDLFSENRLEYQIEQLKVAINASLKSLNEDKGGPTTDLALREFVLSLGSIYQAVKNDKPSSDFRHDGIAEESSGGNFFNFVFTCLTCLDHPPQSRSALGKSIERILKQSPRT